MPDFGFEYSVIKLMENIKSSHYMSFLFLSDSCADIKRQLKVSSKEKMVGS